MRTAYIMVAALLSSAVVVWTVSAQHHEHHEPGDRAQSLRLQPPSAMQQEHEHLHEQLAAAMQSGGKTGEAAKAVEQALGPHFADEEAFAMPPLGLLQALAHGQEIDDEQVHAALQMTEKLRENYQRMLDEHREISAALQRLRAAAQRENKPQHAHFADMLAQHAQHEEQVLYPAALLVGEYLKLKKGAAHP